MPVGDGWTEYQQRPSTITELKSWYANGRQGLGAVTGSVSGNLEALEFDDLPTYQLFLAAAEAAGLSVLVNRIVAGYEEMTPGGGVHWLMRCEEIAGNTTLAARPDGAKVKALIQTRGQGGYIVLAPSGGRVHPSGNAYTLRSGGFASIATVTPEERNALWSLSRSFDERPIRQDGPRTERRGEQRTGDNRPGDDFTTRTSWADILEPHGWVRIFDRGEATMYRRPGKDWGISASTNYAGSDYLYVFSSSTPFEPERGYNKFSAYAILNHDGDFAAAARELGRQGYGKQPTIIQFSKRASAEPESEPTPVPIEEIDPNAYPLTDRGNAQLFAARSAEELRYDHRRGAWLRWGGHWWQSDNNGHAYRVAGRVSEWRANAIEQIEDERDRKAALKWALQSQSRSKIDAILHLAEKGEPLAVAGDAWDTDGYRLGVANGVVDLHTGELLPGDPADTITLHSPVAYDPNATAPRWQQFLSEVFLGDEELITFVQRFAGYSLTADTSEEKMLICWGEGANGKSTLLNALAHAAGDYGYAMPFSTVEAQRNAGGPTNDLAALAGRRLVISSEVNESSPLNEARIKALTGGDPITARFLNHEFFTFQPAAKFWLGVNHKPRVRDESKGFWRRIALLPSWLLSKAGRTRI
jgi:putative DNA primase/helicase